MNIVAIVLCVWPALGICAFLLINFNVQNRIGFSKADQREWQKLSFKAGVLALAIILGPFGLRGPVKAFISDKKE